MGRVRGAAAMRACSSRRTSLSSSRPAMVRLATMPASRKHAISLGADIFRHAYCSDFRRSTSEEHVISPTSFRCDPASKATASVSASRGCGFPWTSTFTSALRFA